MAQAARKILLEPEEQHEPLVPQPRSPQRRPAVPALGMRMAVSSLVIAISVGLLIAFVNTYARIAEYEFERQSLKQQYAQLNRDCIELRLELERLAAQPRLAKVAQAKGLELPSPERVHYLHVASGYPQAYQAQTAPAARPSWAVRSGRQVVAALGNAWQLLGRGAADPAYAQE